MTDKLEIVTVPRELYYHEVAYVRGLEADNERLRAALQFYASPETYTEKAWLKSDDDNPLSIEFDQGERARRALEQKP